MSQFVWTEDHVQDFTRQNPLIQIDAQSLVTDQLIDCLRRDELDAVISNVYINDPVYQMDTLLPRPIYAVVHQSDPLSARPVRSDGITKRSARFLPRGAALLGGCKQPAGCSCGYYSIV